MFGCVFQVVFSDFYDSSPTSSGRGPIVISFGETRDGHKQIRTTGATEPVDDFTSAFQPVT